MQIKSEIAIQKLKESNQLFLELFNHGSLSVEMYHPAKQDLQQPHSRDEIYVVLNGEGKFNLNGDHYHFKAGDFFFVKAGLPHYFYEFSENFYTWVFFYGPEGGE